SSASPVVLSTDPPYYDNIGYSDLSDFFYVWLRLTQREIHSAEFGALLVPKDLELVANAYRHGGSEPARIFFEQGFRSFFREVRPESSEYPFTVYYAFKQSETDDSGESSTGWETLLDGMI